MNLQSLLDLPHYSISQKDKDVLLLSGLNDLTHYHQRKCASYKKMLNLIYGAEIKEYTTLEEIPFFPVRIFKTQTLMSIKPKDKFKTLLSSGTTSAKVSKIYLDRKAATMQTKALSSVIQHFIGSERLPMLIIDSETLIRDRKQFNARGAGVLGMSIFGRNHLYALDENMNLKQEELVEWLRKHSKSDFLIFGFTYMVWKHLFPSLTELTIDLSKATLIHSGGWKKLEDESIDNEEFKRQFFENSGLQRIHNFYGMVEQIGSIFMECEQGYLHSPNFADIIVRDLESLEIAEPDQEGIIQCLSLLPESYPGHSILTEDLGSLIGIDSCQCGKKGKYFQIHGRIPKSEIRGCSDVYAYE